MLLPPMAMLATARSFVLEGPYRQIQATRPSRAMQTASPRFW